MCLHYDPQHLLLFTDLFCLSFLLKCLRWSDIFIWPYPSNKNVAFSVLRSLTETLAEVQETQGKIEWIVALREWLCTVTLRATGLWSVMLLLCSTYVCRGCIKFHMERQGTSWGKHSTAGKWAARKSTIIQNRALTKEGVQKCWL